MGDFQSPHEGSTPSTRSTKIVSLAEAIFVCLNNKAGPEMKEAGERNRELGILVIVSRRLAVEGSSKLCRH